MKQTYAIKTDIFEGPLELLLQLIEKRKLFVNDVSLAEVADDFIEYVEKNDDFPIDQASYFILVASALLLIKSKSLLPNLALTDEEQSNIDELENRLILYKRYRELSQKIGNIMGKKVCIAPIKRTRFVLQSVFTPGEDISVSNISQSIRNVISRIPTLDDIPQATVQKMVRLEDTIEALIERVKTNLKTSFSDFTGGTKEKKTIIVSFLAMLELVKRGIIHVQQTTHFNDIEMETNAIGIPRY